MTARDDTPAFDLGPAAQCGAYTPGHEVHFIQFKLSSREGPGTPATVTALDDDGRIHFADGTTRWNHEPRRLRRAIEHFGSGVLLGAQHVLKVPHDGGGYWFCLGHEPTPCPGPAKAPTSLDDLVGQAQDRGGFLISGADALRLVEERERERDDHGDARTLEDPPLGSLP